METTFALVILLTAASCPMTPPPILQTPACGMPSAITEGLSKEECERMVRVTLKEKPGAQAYCVARQAPRENCGEGWCTQVSRP
jgi:hypothetical protein